MECFADGEQKFFDCSFAESQELVQSVVWRCVDNIIFLIHFKKIYFFEIHDLFVIVIVIVMQLDVQQCGVGV